MRLGTVRRTDGQEVPALFLDCGVVDLAEEARLREMGPPPPPGRRFVEAWARNDRNLWALLGRAAEDPRALLPEGSFRFCPPVPDPLLVMAVGLNYRSHCEEQDRPPPTEPLFFAKLPTCLTGHGNPIPAWPATASLDYEGELAVVIGRPGRQVPAERAMDLVAGYTILNDVTARDLQRRERQWTRAKGLDGFGPCGPWWVPRESLPDPRALRIRTLVNGEVRQDASTSEMLFSVEDLIARLSEGITLRPGDILSTGTPAGVGVFRTPPVFLGPGDLVSIEIEGIGRLTNPVAVPSPNGL